MVTLRLQDEDVRALLDLLRFGAPSAGPLRRVLDQLEVCSVARWVTLSHEHGWGAIGTKGTSIKLEVIKGLRSHIPNLGLKESLELCNKMEQGGVFIPAEAVRYLVDTYPLNFEFSVKSPARLSYSEEELRAALERGETFRGATCDGCAANVNVPMGQQWMCECGHMNSWPNKGTGLFHDPQHGPTKEQLLEMTTKIHEDNLLAGLVPDAEAPGP